MKNILVTGTDTAVGKTFVSSLIIKELRAARIDAVGFKPIACGDRQDVRALRDASELSLSLEQLNPCYLRNSTSPYVACRLENASIDFSSIQQAYDALSSTHDCVIVEGVGGWETPVTETESFGDFATRMALPVLLVVHNRLGALNHTLLTVNAIKAKGLTCVGLILNNVADEWDTACVTNRGVIEQLTGLPLLAELIHGQDYIDIDPILAVLED